MTLLGRECDKVYHVLLPQTSLLSADREAALAAFVSGVDTDRDGKPDSDGVSDILIGLKTYSTSGN